MFSTRPGIGKLQPGLRAKGLLNIEIPLLDIGVLLISDPACDRLPLKLRKAARRAAGRLQERLVQQWIAQGSAKGDVRSSSINWRGVRSGASGPLWKEIDSISGPPYGIIR